MTRKLVFMLEKQYNRQKKNTCKMISVDIESVTDAAFIIFLHSTEFGLAFWSW